AMEFICALLQRVHDDPDTPLGTAVSETYGTTLMQYHGFFVSTAFTVRRPAVSYECLAALDWGGGGDSALAGPGSMEVAGGG
ncbi:hypothetical protein TSOC_015112, partial [Tetrabaena socialis]